MMRFVTMMTGVSGVMFLFALAGVIEGHPLKLGALICSGFAGQ